MPTCVELCWLLCRLHVRHREAPQVYAPYVCVRAPPATHWPDTETPNDGKINAHRKANYREVQSYPVPHALAIIRYATITHVHTQHAHTHIKDTQW